MGGIRTRALCSSQDLLHAVGAHSALIVFAWRGVFGFATPGSAVSSNPQGWRLLTLEALPPGLLALMIFLDSNNWRVSSRLCLDKSVGARESSKHSREEGERVLLGYCVGVNGTGDMNALSIRVVLTRGRGALGRSPHVMFSGLVSNAHVGLLQVAQSVRIAQTGARMLGCAGFVIRHRRHAIWIVEAVARRGKDAPLGANCVRENGTTVGDANALGV